MQKEKINEQRTEKEAVLSYYLNKLLNEHYDKITNQIYLCVYQRKLDTDSWECISGSEIGADKKECMLYERTNKWVRDSRLAGDGLPKELLWRAFCENPKDSFRLILKICIDELLGRFEDILFLDYIEDCGEKAKREKKEDDFQKSQMYKYFFENLMDKDWLNRQYVKKVLEEYHLPDWKLFVQISAMFYEKRTIKTYMYFREEESNRTPVYSLRFCGPQEGGVINTLDCSNLRTIRKMMEISGEDHGLWVEMPDYEIKGVVRKLENADGIVSVEFSDHLIWSLQKGEETLFEYRKGEYKLPELETKDDNDRQFEKMELLGLEPQNVEIIKSAIEMVSKKAEHGTSIVFMEDALLEIEVKRLVPCGRAFRLEDFDLQSVLDDVKGILAIDGALMVNLNGKCRAIGAILDGKASEKGDSARGARYNSLVSYIHNLKENNKNCLCFSVIVSEDGMVNIEIPE